jgi:hypothetical protein
MRKAFTLGTRLGDSMLGAFEGVGSVMLWAAQKMGIFASWAKAWARALT